MARTWGPSRAGPGGSPRSRSQPTPLLLLQVHHLPQDGGGEEHAQSCVAAVHHPCASPVQRGLRQVGQGLHLPPPRPSSTCSLRLTPGPVSTCSCADAALPRRDGCVVPGAERMDSIVLGADARSPWLAPLFQDSEDRRVRLGPRWQVRRPQGPAVWQAASSCTSPAVPTGLLLPTRGPWASCWELPLAACPGSSTTALPAEPGQGSLRFHLPGSMGLGVEPRHPGSSHVGVERSCVQGWVWPGPGAVGHSPCTTALPPATTSLGSLPPATGSSPAPRASSRSMR